MRSKVEKPVLLQSTQYSDVANFQSTTVGVSIEIFGRNINPMNPFAGRESAIHVTLTNQGENDIENAIVEARCTENLQFVDSGALFGTGRRHVRLPRLRPSKKIKYKLALRTTPSLTHGSVTLELRSADWKSSDQVQTFTLNVSRQG
jgi:hypothetical protein